MKMALKEGQIFIKERVNENTVPMIDPPIKVSPFKHQIRGYNMALMVLGLIEPPTK